jgi:hypothetical protein
VRTSRANSSARFPPAVAAARERRAEMSDLPEATMHKAGPTYALPGIVFPPAGEYFTEWQQA